jgi:1-deoxy-D-xylulose-5-phosphate reductoisomerase
MSEPVSQRLYVLGSTGSVGRNTLEVASRHPGRYRVFALAAARNVAEMAAQCVVHRPAFAIMVDEAAARELRQTLSAQGIATEVLAGARALDEMAAHPQVDVVMAAIVGAAGLSPCLAAARSGKRLLLANKEALVMGGALLMRAVTEGGAQLLPIDSEHSAIFQCLPLDRALWPQWIDHIILTASGGPLRQRDPATFASVRPEEACAHPNWSMGRKISVDSATMMNKALEVIEARWLFDLAPSQIRVVVHPQSIIHSMVVCRDRSVMAQLGTPDMKVPIAVGLSWPQRIESGASALDFLSLGALTFEAPDARRYPGLALAWAALEGARGGATVLNAANEIAVDAFLRGQIRFDQIHHVNAHILERLGAQDAGLEEVGGLIELDARARDAARTLARSLSC